MRKLTTRRLQRENLHLTIQCHDKGSATIALRKKNGGFYKNIFIIEGQIGRQRWVPSYKRLIKKRHWNFGQETAYVRFMDIGVITKDVEPIVSFFLTFVASCYIENKAAVSLLIDPILRAARNFPCQECSTAHHMAADQLNGFLNVCESRIERFAGSSKDLNAFLKRWMRQTTPFYKFCISMERVDMEDVLDQIKVKVLPMGFVVWHPQYGVTQRYEMTRDGGLTVVVYYNAHTFEIINKERI
ncbi:unnamed protein product [Caenorhabditis nigoni]